MKLLKWIALSLVVILLATFGVWILDGYRLYESAWDSQTNGLSFNSLKSRSPLFANALEASYEEAYAKSRVVSITNWKLQKLDRVRQGAFHFRTFRLTPYIHLFLNRESAYDRILSSAYFGWRSDVRVAGAETAAQYFLARELEQLSISDVATLLALEGPDMGFPRKHRDAHTLRRRNFVIDQLVELGVVSESDAVAAKATALATPKQIR